MQYGHLHALFVVEVHAVISISVAVHFLLQLVAVTPLQYDSKGQAAHTVSVVLVH